MLSIKEWIKRYEPFTPHPQMNKNGKVTIGYGRILDDKGLSQQEGDCLFDNDFYEYGRELSGYSWYAEKPIHVQAALINMCFAIGIDGILRCIGMIESLNDEDYTNAALAVMETPWAHIDKSRAKDVALMMREGCQ